MRIGVIASVSHHLESFWHSLGTEMDVRGNQVFFAAGDVSTMPNYTMIRGVTRRPSLANLTVSRNLRAWAHSNKLDVVITNTATVSFLIRHAGIQAPIVYFAHGLHWAQESGLSYLIWSTLERLSLGKTAGAIVLNREDEEWFRRVAPQVPLLRLRYGVGLPTERFPRSETPRVHEAVWIGEFSKRKRPEIAIKAAAELAAILPDFKLSMLGRGDYLKSSKDLAYELGVADRVSFPGHIDPAPYLDKSAVLIHTASWEGLPRVVLEAMAVGRPIIGTDAKGMRGLDGVQLVASGDPNALASAIHSLFVDGELATSRVSVSDLDCCVAADKILNHLEIVRTRNSAPRRRSAAKRCK